MEERDLIRNLDPIWSKTQMETTCVGTRDMLSLIQTVSTNQDNKIWVWLMILTWKYISISMTP